MGNCIDGRYGRPVIPNLLSIQLRLCFFRFIVRKVVFSALYTDVGYSIFYTSEYKIGFATGAVADIQLVFIF